MLRYTLERPPSLHQKMTTFQLVYPTKGTVVYIGGEYIPVVEGRRRLCAE